jgi:hypothetical protein
MVYLAVLAARRWDPRRRVRKSPMVILVRASCHAHRKLIMRDLPWMIVSLAFPTTATKPRPRRRPA